MFFHDLLILVRRVVVVVLVRLVVVSSCRPRRVTFICMRTIKTSKVYLINDKKSNQWLSMCYNKT